MDAMQRLARADAVRRLWAKDASLFTDDETVARDVADRLGWLGLASADDAIGEGIRALASAAGLEGVTDVALLGMGGSSLAPLVISRILAAGEGHPRLHVLDTTAPGTVLDVLAAIDPATTWVLVSSKSGTTIEPLSLYAVLRERFDAALGEGAGEHFIAVTDPGTPLESMAREAGFRAVVHAPADVGGRYSALTPFGLLPAALVRADADALVASAEDMERKCRRPDAEGNPGAALAAFLIDCFEAGRDKLTLVTPESLRPFGLWVEQLVAESTGKHGTGIVPVLERKPSIPIAYGPDRAVVVMRLEDDDTLAGWAGVAADEGAPVHEIALADPTDIGGEFVRWEVATALAGHLLGIDPFDQPDVAAAKAATSAVLEGRQAAREPACGIGGIDVTYGGPLEEPAAPPALAEALEPLLDSLRPRDYVALLVYLPERDELLRPLEDVAEAIEHGTGNAVCVELGPRYLHSTGQLHKGGADEGVFLMVTARSTEDVAIPGRPFGMAELWRAQAAGDFAALAEHGRRVVRLDLPSVDANTVQALAVTLSAVALNGTRA